MRSVPGLAEADLFSALDATVIEDLALLMTSVTFAPGEVVFRQGERGDCLLVVSDGELEALLEVPGGDHLHLSSIGPGHVIGELALLGDGVRTATVRAVAQTSGWTLARSSFEILRHDVRPAASQIVHVIGRQAVSRLDRLYRRCADGLTGEPRPDERHATGIGEVSPERGEIDYLRGVLFFRGFSHAEVVEVTQGLPRLAVPRGAMLTLCGNKPAALWIVVRGAVQTRMRGGGATRSMRLAGPGRAIGHVGLLGETGFADRVESCARERSILLEVPWATVDRLLADDRPSSRRFAAAMWTDVVRALQHGERPLARTRARSTNGAMPSDSIIRPRPDGLHLPIPVRTADEG